MMMGVELFPVLIGVTIGNDRVISLGREILAVMGFERRFAIMMLPCPGLPSLRLFSVSGNRTVLFSD